MGCTESTRPDKEDNLPLREEPFGGAYERPQDFKRFSVTACDRLLLLARSQISNAVSELSTICGDENQDVAERIGSELDEALMALLDLGQQLRQRRGRSSGVELPDEELAAHDKDVTKGILTLYHGRDDAQAKSHTNMMDAHSALLKNPSTIGRRFSQRVIEFDENVTRCLMLAGTMPFDGLELVRLTDRPIASIGHYIEDSQGIIDGLARESTYINEATTFQKAFVAYLRQLDGLYRPDVPYHGPAHAVDVMSTMMWSLSSEFFRRWTSAPDRFMSLVAAAIHDVGHPGKNNIFLARTWELNLQERTANLALRYNDKSILENFHIAVAFETMQKREETNWFCLLNTAASNGVNMRSYIRRGLIEMVLHTDMSKHGENQKLLDDFSEEQTGSDNLEDKLFILGSTLHAVDISNPCKPRPIMLAWTRRILDEFWAQGDVEKALGFTSVTMFCDREVDRSKIPARQLGFIGFVVEPYWRSLTAIVPEMQQAVDQLTLNKMFWQDKVDEEATFEQLFGVADK